MDLLSQYSNCVGGIARKDVVRVEYRFRATHVKQPPATPKQLFRVIQWSDL